MRKYGLIPIKFWTGTVGKTIKGDPEAQALAAYLYSARLSHMSGLYMLPLDYASSDLGWDTTRAMRVLIECGHCEYDETTDTVFIKDFARLQIAPTMVRTDNRHKAVCRQLEELSDSPLVKSFEREYGIDYNLGPESKPLVSPFEAPSKPGIRDQGTEISHSFTREGANVIDIDRERIDRLVDDEVYEPTAIEQVLPQRWGSSMTLGSRPRQAFAKLKLTGAQIKLAVARTYEGASTPCLAYFISVAGGVVKEATEQAKGRAGGTPMNYKRPKIIQNTPNEPVSAEQRELDRKWLEEYRAKG